MQGLSPDPAHTERPTWSAGDSGAAVAGIGAAIVPARRASRLDVLEAISQE